MKTFDDALLARYRQELAWPTPDRGRFEAGMPVIELAPSELAYTRTAGYDFEAACMCHATTGERLLFIRIDEWEPDVRRTAQLDYCIPLAYDGASPAERLRWTIPFGGAWSDTREAALLVFDTSWRSFFERVVDRVAFANPGARSGALFRIDARQRPKLDAFRVAYA